MIITRTPFRVTLGGGGTDLPSYYSKNGGFVFSMAISHYMYVATNPPTIDRKIRLHYSKSETVDHVSQLQHDLAREALLYHGIEDKMEVSSMADIPAGTGVGSSSCYLVGLLMALHHYKRDYVTLHQLAEEACDIELNILKKGIGKQDQYMAAFGGLTSMTIKPDGEVAVATLNLGSGAIAELVANTHIYYTGTRRSAETVLADQDNDLKKSTETKQANQASDNMDRIKELGYKMQEAVLQENFDAWGTLTHEHWLLKKRLSSKISLSEVDDIYEDVRANYGVLGGKIIGAGGGGFLLLYCPTKHKNLEQHMASLGMPRLHYSLDPEGCKVVASLSNPKAFDDRALVGQNGTNIGQ
jgi:D-glycero-alpha-D-manno-heptose-7-phosphate kinase